MDNLKEANVNDIIKSLESGFGTEDDSQAKTLQLLKGIIFSDDPKAKEYVKKLDAATTKISKEMSGEKTESYTPDDIAKDIIKWNEKGGYSTDELKKASFLNNALKQYAIATGEKVSPDEKKALQRMIANESNKIKVKKAFTIPGTDIQLKEGQVVTVLQESQEMLRLYNEMKSSSYFDDVKYERSYDSITARWEGVKEIMISTPMAPDLDTTYSYSAVGSADNEQGFNSLNDLVSQLTRSTMY